jgi:hypothetical protein
MMPAFLVAQIDRKDGRNERGGKPIRAKKPLGSPGKAIRMLHTTVSAVRITGVAVVRVSMRPTMVQQRLAFVGHSGFIGHHFLTDK